MKTAFGMPIVDSVPGEAVPMHMALFTECCRKFMRSDGEIVLNDVHLLCPFNMLPHDRARMKIFNDAIESECDYLFFVDDDMMIPPGAFWQLYETMFQNRAQVVCGHYYRRGIPYGPLVFRQEKIDNVISWMALDIKEGVHQIDSSGLGCALIDLRWIKENLRTPYCVMEVDPIEGTKITDDTSFFRNVREKGGLILCNANIRCGHLSERMPVCDRTVDFLVKSCVENQVAAISSNENGA